MVILIELEIDGKHHPVPGLPDPTTIMMVIKQTIDLVLEKFDLFLSL